MGIQLAAFAEYFPFSMNPPPHRMQPGTVVDGRYRVSTRDRYVGGVATYTATHLLVGRNVRLDVLTRPEAKAKRRFRRGGRLLGLMRHPHIVMLYDMGEHEGEAPYLALEYLAGQTLQERSEQNGAMPTAEAVRITDQLLSALGYIHERRIIHRAVSTTKVHIGADWAGNEQITLTGFSMSRDLGAPASSSFSAPDGVALSDFAHVAPEQIIAPETVDHRTDLYSAGVTLYQLLTGASPFPQKSIAELGESILHEMPLPPSEHVAAMPRMDDLVMQALAKEPSHRFADASAFRHALRSAAA